MVRVQGSKEVAIMSRMSKLERLNPQKMTVSLRLLFGCFKYPCLRTCLAHSIGIYGLRVEGFEGLGINKNVVSIGIVYLCSEVPVYLPT